MTDPLQDPLSKILDTFDQRRLEQQEVREAVDQREDMFLLEFENFSKTIICPLFERVGNHISSRGHDFEISTQKYEVGDQGEITGANISLTLYPLGIERHGYQRNQYPSFTVLASRTTQKLRLHGSTITPGGSGSAEPRGDYDFEHLTSEILERELMKLLTEVFAGK